MPQQDNKPFEDILALTDKNIQNTVIFELLFKEKYFRCIAETKISGKYVFALTDYLQQLRQRSPDVAFNMTRLFRQLFINDHFVALKLIGSDPQEVHFMFAFDYPQLANEEKQNYQLIPAKLLWEDWQLN